MYNSEYLENKISISSLACPTLNVAIKEAHSILGQKCPSPYDPVVSGQWLSFTSTASGGYADATGFASYTFELLIDGISVQTSPTQIGLPSIGLSYAFTGINVSSVTGTHTYETRVKDGCSPPQIVSDFCNITIGEVSSPSPSPTPPVCGIPQCNYAVV